MTTKAEVEYVGRQTFGGRTARVFEHRFRTEGQWQAWLCLAVDGKVVGMRRSLEALLDLAKRGPVAV